MEQSTSMKKLLTPGLILKWELKNGCCLSRHNGMLYISVAQPLLKECAVEVLKCRDIVAAVHVLCLPVIFADVVKGPQWK